MEQSHDKLQQVKSAVVDLSFWSHLKMIHLAAGETTSSKWVRTGLGPVTEHVSLIEGIGFGPTRVCPCLLTCRGLGSFLYILEAAATMHTSVASWAREWSFSRHSVVVETSVEGNPHGKQSTNCSWSVAPSYSLKPTDFSYSWRLDGTYTVVQ
jgi:hypothetical protein